MPNNMQKALKQFQHKAGKLKHASYQSAQIQYGAKKCYTRIKGTTVRAQSQVVHPTGMPKVYSLAEQLIAIFFAQSAP